ncbi:serine hydrolase domain-containing protein [Actinoplanes sp. NEAU-A12]|uniref:Beta-lactamase n=1 Tax=Actinoplanes sandaracinus TaxID=3045177 RepID=A0ABT6WR56_9ACTN|nr:serine hydrolase domain-containing protein [Actinoplanes sandaracinus]MDI6102219.1 serine hydrolase domain-containing protein [Actinoplanes sandaracinus]
MKRSSEPRRTSAVSIQHGDEALAARLRTLLGGRHPVAAAATISPGERRVAGLGADAGADFEIGSVSKGVTGLLYAEALARGEIDRTATLGDLLPLGRCPAARVTLASLSVHRSGLPILPRSAGLVRRSVALWRHGANPYGDSLDQLIVQARSVTVGKPRPRYSNLGFELLGHAIAAAAGVSYRELVRARIADPLGLDVFYAPAIPAELRPGALTGVSRFGRERQPWTGEAVGPAGGIRASIEAMARLIAALLDGSAPGLSALDPTTRFAGVAGRAVDIGAGWITLEHEGRKITWHNGGTGGFRSWLGLDRAAGAGVVIVTATAMAVDGPGFTLLTETAGRNASRAAAELTAETDRR